jgi:hypothetical protein
MQMQKSNSMLLPLQLQLQLGLVELMSEISREPKTKAALLLRVHRTAVSGK